MGGLRTGVRDIRFACPAVVGVAGATQLVTLLDILWYFSLCLNWWGGSVESSSSLAWAVLTAAMVVSWVWTELQVKHSLRGEHWRGLVKRVPCPWFGAAGAIWRKAGVGGR